MEIGHFISENWGNLASVAGLLVSLWVLRVAKSANEAAEEARVLARKRTLIEDLEDANTKIAQVGTLVRDRKWELVQLRAQEVLTISTSTIARWGDQLKRDSNNLKTTCTLMMSVAELAHRSSLRQLTEGEQLQVFKAQLRANELTSGVLGRARKSEERS